MEISSNQSNIASELLNKPGVFFLFFWQNDKKKQKPRAFIELLLHETGERRNDYLKWLDVQMGIERVILCLVRTQRNKKDLH